MLPAEVNNAWILLNTVHSPQQTSVKSDSFWDWLPTNTKSVSSLLKQHPVVFPQMMCQRRRPSDLPSQFESLFNFLEGVGSAYHNFMRNGSGKLLVYHLLCLTGREGLGTRLGTRCLPCFSIHHISCRSQCRRELNKPTDVWRAALQGVTHLWRK